MATYVTGIGRNPGEQYGVHHLYAEVAHEHDAECSAICQLEVELRPMCRYGWNRDRGFAFSIFRGHEGARGLCVLCARNADENKPPSEPWPHHTRYI